MFALALAATGFAVWQERELAVRNEKIRFQEGIEQASPLAGVPIGFADLRAAMPTLPTPVFVPYGDDRVAFPPTEGGLAAAAALMSLRNQPADTQSAYARGLAAAGRWRAGGANSDQILNGELAMPATTPLYPASTTFAT